MKYRPDIDGLRAIAILFVLFFHGGFKLFPSGFIGVDIFFVISGFLITSLIYGALQTNSFSLSEFYTRRLWRLQPAFLCLIVVTALLALWFYLPEDLVKYFKSARKTSLFISNNFFERVTNDYFSPSNNQLPLLHTWSLSIEWQCYLLLPVALYALYKVFAKRFFTLIIYILMALFFVFALYGSAHYSSQSYYRLISRIFEFLAGACVAVNANHKSYNKYSLNLIAISAVIVLFYIATRDHISEGFPNWYAFLLCLATAVLIASGQSNPQPVITRWLSIKPLVFIGLISYSLYIWHWPVLALIRYIGVEETPMTSLLIFVLIFVLAFFSWRFIEKTGRKFNKSKLRVTLLLLFVLPVTLIHISNSVIKKNAGYPQRFAETSKIEERLRQYADAQRALCINDKSSEVSKDCLLGSVNPGHKTGFMIGDSHSNHYWRFVDLLAKKANLSVLSHATASCLALPGLSQYDWNHQEYTACREQVARYYNMIKANHYAYVILGHNWGAYESLIINISSKPAQKRIEKALDEALEIITASGAKPVLLKSVALTHKSSFDCFYAHIKQRRKYQPESCNYKVNTEEQQWLNDLFLRMKSKYTQLIIIDPQSVQCPNGQCRVDINGIPVFRDQSHITDYAAYHWAKIYLRHYNNPLG